MSATAFRVFRLPTVIASGMGLPQRTASAGGQLPPTNPREVPRRPRLVRQRQAGHFTAYKLLIADVINGAKPA
jgi:hypothetical protein